MEPPPRNRVSICHRDQDGGGGVGNGGQISRLWSLNSLLSRTIVPPHAGFGFGAPFRHV